MSGKPGVGIKGLGAAVPDTVVTNDDLIKRGLDTSDEWIKSRTGIAERRIAGPQTAASDLATEAGLKALRAAGLSAADIDLIIVGTATSDYLLFPSTACLVQHKIGCRQVAAFDVSAACSGFTFALATAEMYLRSGLYQHALVVGVDVLSKWVDWTDRSICVLFGDGAGAVVLGPVRPGYGILHSRLYSDGSGENLLVSPAGGSREPLSHQILDAGRHFATMDGKAVFKFATQVITKTVEDGLLAAGLQKSDIKLLALHQANWRITQYAAEKLELKPDQVGSNIHKYGNTSAASIPLLLSDYQGQLEDGDIVVALGFGAGLTWGVNVIRWGGRS